MEGIATFILGHESQVRLAAFAAIIAVMAVWEVMAPRRNRTLSRRVRWPSNLGIVALNTVALRFVFPTAAVGIALLAQERGWGLLNIWSLPGWLKFAVAFVVLDVVIYLQHVVFHGVPFLWRLHRMHHTDLDIDVTTGARFHPGEILISMLLKMAVVVALGAPVIAVVVFEIVLNAAAMFNHGNVKLSAGLDNALRWIVVTPDMHRVHHSVIPAETNSNFGFNLAWWDRLFGTYRPQPKAGHEGMTIGLDIFRDPAQLRIDRMLVQPFIGPARAHPIRWRNDQL